MTTPNLTRRHAVRAAARTWWTGCEAMDRMSVEAAARACHVAGGPSLAELVAAITTDRAHRAVPARRAA
ncbi:hypothetical protein ACQEVM_38395 [Streptomyces sp. CA-243310]|uniref:hypothetical protein n=1 Tax=Streptomyces sp. CA-243310 TaxID=3240056 RepID=UPI003D90060F